MLHWRRGQTNKMLHWRRGEKIESLNNSPPSIVKYKAHLEFPNGVHKYELENQMIIKNRRYD